MVLPAATGLFAAEKAEYLTRRIGNWDISRWAGLDVIADEKQNVIHLVYRDNKTLYYTQSIDGGNNWKRPHKIVEGGMHPRLALDSRGVVHMVYCSARNNFPSDRIPQNACYLYLQQDRWSRSVRLNGPSEGSMDVRIAVDGNDNVHIMFWNRNPTPTEDENKVEWHRCIYRRKPVGSNSFEKALHFKESDGTGGGQHGTMAVGPRGEVHLLYRTVQSEPRWTGNMEHRVREKDGRWQGEPQKYENIYLTDYSLSAVVDEQGVLHLGCYTFRPGGFKCKYYRKEPKGELREMYVDDETYGTSTDIIQTPNGNIWLAGSGNWGSRRNKRIGPARSCYHYYEEAQRKWHEKIFLSSEDTVNVDTFYPGPRLLWYNNQVRLFYAEQKPGENYKLYQRVFANPYVPEKLHQK